MGKFEFCSPWIYFDPLCVVVIQIKYKNVKIVRVFFHLWTKSHTDKI